MAQLTQLKLIVTVSPGFSGETYMVNTGTRTTPIADLLAPAFYVSTTHPNPPPTYSSFYGSYGLNDLWGGSGQANPFEIVVTAPPGLATGDILTFNSSGPAGIYASEEVEVYGVYDDGSEVLFGSGNTSELDEHYGLYTEIELTVPEGEGPRFWTNYVTTRERGL